MSDVWRLKDVTLSTQEPVAREDMKRWLGVDEDQVLDDSLIEGLIVTARARYEEVTKRSLYHQTFDAYRNEPPSGTDFYLPRSPLVSIGSIKGFTDTDATDTGGTAMNSTGYYVDVASEPGRVVAIGGASWPTATRIANAFIVRFTAGYSTSSTGVPEEAKTTIKKMVARAYEHRGDEGKDAVALMAEVLDDLLLLPEWG